VTSGSVPAVYANYSIRSSAVADNSYDACADVAR